MDDVTILDRGKLARQSADSGDVEFVLVRLRNIVSFLFPRIVSGVEIK